MQKAFAHYFGVFMFILYYKKYVIQISFMCVQQSNKPKTKMVKPKKILENDYPNDPQILTYVTKKTKQP